MFLLNMAFITSSEVENIYIFHFTSAINAIFNKKSFEFSFYYIQPYQQRGTYVHCTFFKLSLFLALSLDNEHESMLKGNQIKSSKFSSNFGVIK